MTIPMSPLRTLIFGLFTFVCVSHVTAAEVTLRDFPDLNSKGVVAKRGGSQIHLKITDPTLKQVSIPRLAAALRGIDWKDASVTSALQLQVEQEEWIIKWKGKAAADELVLTFESEPLLLSEVKAVRAAGDGSFYLPACLASTSGEKVRYEPQTFKNTVGYWVGKKDSATWKVQLDLPGRYNVAILQGCGKGQGGSDAQMSFTTENAEAAKPLNFKISETGHFQNFQWRHLGEVEFTKAGIVELKVEPTKIANKALVDIRAISLVRLPAKK